MMTVTFLNEIIYESVVTKKEVQAGKKLKLKFFCRKERRMTAINVEEITELEKRHLVHSV